MGSRGNYKEKGMASLMVTTILMLVISLLVVGFSQVARRNQREALDRQLSSQAYYATESGINAATAVVRNKIDNNQLVPSKTDCAPDANYPEVKLSGDDVKVTCLLVEPEVESLIYDEVSENMSTIVPVTPVTGVVGAITITWRPTGSAATASAGCRTVAAVGYSLPQRNGWGCGHGLLRLDMSRVPGGAITDQARTVFLYPHMQNAPVDATSTIVTEGGTQTMFAARCSDSGNDPKCMATINLTSATDKYYLNLRSIYKKSKVTVDGIDLATSTNLSFKGQVKLDVTARAVDVLKRVQVRIPVEEQRGGTAPAYGIETSESLCKRFSVAPGYYYAEPQAGCE